MLNPLQNAELFLINTLFDLYLLILMIRFILCWVRADYFNPVTRFIVRMTQPIISPLRRLIPTYANIEFATLFFILVLEVAKFFLVGLIVFGMPKAVAGILILACADTLKLLLNAFFYAIFLSAILSWFQPGYSPMVQLLTRLTSPIMQPIQRLIPPVGGFDLSPIPALIILQLLIIVLVSPLQTIGMGIAFG